MHEDNEDLLQFLSVLSVGALARKAEFVEQADGSALRRVAQADGTVEEAVISPERWMVVGARAKAGLSQAEFAKGLCVSKRTLQDWEQGRKRPPGAVRVLLRIIARYPDILRDAAP